MSQRKNVFDSHSETEQIVWHRCKLAFITRSRWDSHELELDQGTMASKPFVTHSLQHDGAWNFAWYYASLVVYAVLDDFRGLELPRTRTRTRTRIENWSSRILEDKDFPRGQQHWLLCLSGLLVRRSDELKRPDVWLWL